MNINTMPPQTTHVAPEPASGLIFKWLLVFVVVTLLLGGSFARDAKAQSDEEEFQRKMDELKRRGKQEPKQTREESAQPLASTATESSLKPSRLRKISAILGTCRQQYDRFRDTTSFDLVVGTIYKPNGVPSQKASRSRERSTPTEELRLALAATTSGKQPDAAPPKQVDFYFQSIAPNYRYRDEAEVLMIIDGERVKIGNAYSHGGLAIVGEVVEQLRMSVATKLFLRIADGREVDVRIGTNEFRLESSTLQAMRDFASCTEMK